MTLRKISVLGLSFAMAGMMTVAAPLSAEADEWNMCEWEAIPENVLNRIVRRGDYDDILRRMFDSCPDAALSLTERPTGSLGLFSYEDRSGGPASNSASGAGQSGSPSAGPADGGASAGDTGAQGDEGVGGDGTDTAGEGDGPTGGEQPGSEGPGPGGPGGGLSLG